MEIFEPFKTSRILNEAPTYAGLDQNDLLVTLSGTMLLFFGLSTAGLELLTPILAFIWVLFLIPIRLKYRRKFVRDAARFYFVKLFKNGVVYDPADNRRYRN